ncbi:MAG: EFR1 family ferrodoxin [Endomicrobium sp.]|nr:EFR1 family ferrodoxin [Endomicrobium sp.]
MKNKKKKGDKKIIKIKTVDIYCFTGTGNTYLAAKKIEETLKNSGCTVSISDITKTDPEKINLSNVIGIGFPIAVYNTFPVVKKFINNFPKAEMESKIFIFTTMGNNSLNAALNFGDILKKKGYCIIGVGNFLMPNNFIAVQKKEENNILKREKAYEKMKIFAKELIDERSKLAKPNLFSRICFVISGFIMDRWRSNLFQKIVRFNVAKSKCTKCCLCVKICPVKNISFDGCYPVFNGKKCQVCMRCISYCPTKAIKSFFVGRTYKGLTDDEVKRCFL